MRDIRTHYELVDRRHQQQTIDRPTPVPKEDIKKPCYLFLDQASTTGYALFDDDSRLVLSGVLKKEDENIQTFMHETVSLFEELAIEYGVKNIFYEEVYIPSEVSLSTAEKLHYIKHKIQDIQFNQPHIEVLGIDANKWKKELARPQTFKKTGDDKKQVLKFVEEIFPLVTMVTNDESDAIGMGIAVMIKGKNKKNIYNVTRFNAKLPIHLEIINNEVNLFDEKVINKLPVRYKRPHGIGGLYELNLNKATSVERDLRKYLSHKDSLVFVRIPRDYKYWGLLLLVNNKSVHEITSEDKSYTIIASRKRRL